MAWQPISEFDGTTRLQRCSICGGDQRKGKDGPEPLYTTGVFIDFEGRFDVCHSCIAEVAKMARFVPLARLQKEQEALKESREANEALQRALDSKTQALQVLTNQLAEREKQPAA